MTNKLPAFHVGEYLADELNARGWSTMDLAVRMGGDVVENVLTIDMTLAKQPELTLAPETAKGFARAFGTNAETWLKLDAEFQRREFGDDN